MSAAGDAGRVAGGWLVGFGVVGAGVAGVGVVGSGGRCAGWVGGVCCVGGMMGCGGCCCAAIPTPDTATTPHMARICFFIGGPP
jgi:hypothetical protein